MQPACPRCAGPIDPGFRFCKCCGLDLAGGTTPAPAPAAATPDTWKLLHVAMAKFGVIAANFLILRLNLAMNFPPWILVRVTDLLLALGLTTFIGISATKTQSSKFRILLWVFAGIELLNITWRVFRAGPDIFFQSNF